MTEIDGVPVETKQNQPQESGTVEEKVEKNQSGEDVEMDHNGENVSKVRVVRKKYGRKFRRIKKKQDKRILRRKEKQIKRLFF